MQHRHPRNLSGLPRSSNAITGRRRKGRAARPAVLVLVLPALAASLGLFAAPAWAATSLTVDTLTDATHSSNDCATGAASSCSLRDAITQANTNGGGAIVFKSGLSGTITLGNMLPTITTSNVTITGPTSGSGPTLTNLVTVSGANSNYILWINPNVTGAAISNLNLVNGYGSSSISTRVGGAITNYGTLVLATTVFSGNLGASAMGGGAIYNGGTLTVTGSTFSGNTASNSGGAIYNAGTATVSGSTFTGNSAKGAPSAGGAAGGGAIYNYEGTVTVTDSTFSANSAIGTGGNVGGGAIFNYGALTATNATFFENSAAVVGGAIFNYGTVSYTGAQTLTVYNSIFSKNSAPSDDGGGIYNNGSGVIDGYNVFYQNTGGDTAGFQSSSATDVTGKDPMLAPLGWYGGPTETMALLPGSAAICAGDDIYLPAGMFTDQRGYKIDSACPLGADAGAVQTNQYVVNTLNDSNDGSCTSTTCSLRDGVTAANAAGGDISFAPGVTGTITLTSTLPAISGQFNLLGPGAQSLTVSGNKSATVGSVFTVNSGANAFFYGLTTANGNGNCASNNNGGAICNAGNLEVAYCAFSANSAASGGGAIYNNQGTVTVSNSTFTSGKASFGGAIDNSGSGTLSVTNSSFSTNSATGSGGAIIDYGTLTATDSTFSANSAGFGGAIFTSAGTLTVTNSTFSANSVSATTVANGGGGAIEVSGTTTVTNSTFSGNQATGSGGGAFYNWAGTLTTANNIFTGNSATSGGGIYMNGGTLKEQSNLYYNNAGGDIDNPSGSMSYGSGDVSGASPKLSALGWYGGPTQTMIPLSGSEALCAGQHQSGGPTTDQRGAPDATCTNNPIYIDIGSVQVSGNPPMIGAVTPNSGTPTGGTSVVITGTGLDSPTAVSFGSTAAVSYTVTAATSTAPAYITAVSPAESTGTVDVTVTNSSGTSATSPADEFTYATPVATPTISPSAGTYVAAQSVTITDSTTGATIYYTTDGTTPTTASTKYSGAITISASETINAIAVAGGYANSAEASASYTINPNATSAATPTFSPAAGTYASAQSVTISDATSGAVIYYTTDGSTPTTASTQYSAAIAVSASETINAIAVAGGYVNSAMATATYTINPSDIPSFEAGPGGTTTLTVTAGATTGNTATIVVEGTYGFSGTVSLTCSGTTDLPTVHDKPTCSLSPTFVTLSATTTTANSTLTIMTTAPTSSKNQMPNLFWPSAGGTALALLFFFVPRRRKNWPALLGLLVIFLGIGFIGCGGGKHNGGGGGGGTNPAGTTTGSYTVVVTGTSGSTTATVGTIALTVQ